MLTIVSGSGRPGEVDSRAKRQARPAPAAVTISQEVNHTRQQLQGDRPSEVPKGISCTILPVLEFCDALKGHLLAHYVDVRIVPAFVLQQTRRPITTGQHNARHYQHGYVWSAWYRVRINLQPSAGEYEQCSGQLYWV